MMILIPAMRILEIPDQKAMMQALGRREKMNLVIRLSQKRFLIPVLFQRKKRLVSSLTPHRMMTPVWKQCGKKRVISAGVLHLQQMKAARIFF